VFFVIGLWRLAGLGGNVKDDFALQPRFDGSGMLKIVSDTLGNMYKIRLTPHFHAAIYYIGLDGLKNFADMLITTESGRVISGLKDHFTVLRTCRCAGSAYSRPHLISHTHGIFKEDAGQFMSHHCYFIGADSVYAIQNFLDSVGNLLFLPIREGLLYMMSHN